MGLAAPPDNYTIPFTSIDWKIWLSSLWSNITGKGISVQSDVTTSRVLGTVYQNTTGSPMFVNVSLAGPSGVIQASTGSNSQAMTLVVYTNLSTSRYSAISFWVLPGNYYEVYTDANGQLELWVEWH
jgi:hypothetical protein